MATPSPFGLTSPYPFDSCSHPKRSTAFGAFGSSTFAPNHSSQCSTQVPRPPEHSYIRPDVLSEILKISSSNLFSSYPCTKSQHSFTSVSLSRLTQEKTRQNDPIHNTSTWYGRIHVLFDARTNYSLSTLFPSKSKSSS